MALMFLLLVLQWRAAARPQLHDRDRQGLCAQRHAARPLRWVTFAICVAFFALTVVLPVGQLLLSSFFQFFGFYSSTC